MQTYTLTCMSKYRVQTEDHICSPYVSVDLLANQDRHRPQTNKSFISSSAFVSFSASTAGMFQTLRSEIPANPPVKENLISHLSNKK